jgi:hypothetical protein
MGTMSTLINATPDNDGGNIAQAYSEMALMSPGATQAQQDALTALQAGWNTWMSARAAAITAFSGQ